MNKLLQISIKLKKKMRILKVFSSFLCLTVVTSTIVRQEETLTPNDLNMLYESGEYEKFSRSLGIEDVNLVRPYKGVSKEFKHDDILLTREQTEQERQVLNYSAYPGNKWKNGVIPYSIISKSYKSINDILAIVKAVAKWNKEVPEVQFRRWRKTDTHYIAIFNGNGCYSHLGKVGARQSVSLQSPGCLKTGTILHELMHTVGFTHEQNRPDRDKYIRLLTKNIPEEWRSSYRKVDSADFNILGPYDYFSIMHYPIKAPSSNLPAFEILQAGVDIKRIGQRLDLSSTDKDKIKMLYKT